MGSAEGSGWGAAPVAAPPEDCACSGLELKLEALTHNISEMHEQIEHLQASASRTCADGGMEPEMRRDLREWGSDEYDHCEQPFSWSELLAAYKAGERRSAQDAHGAYDITFKSGGLGKKLDKGGYMTWVCIKDHFCGDPYFCWVYHETRKVFTPWGTARELRLRSVVDGI